MDWAHSLPPLLTTFLASLVECIEALTVVLAVGAVFGWAGALVGAGAALALLFALVAAFGPLLTLISLRVIHLAVGALLLAFGGRWLRKAVLRAAGIIPLRDENLAYARQNKRYLAIRSGPDGARHGGLIPAFQITGVEGIEIVFIVLAVGGADPGALLPASLGALAAVLVVCAAGLVLHRPIASIPENTLKLTVGVLTCAFGVFWLGEGIGIEWPGEDWSILALTAAIFAVTLAVIRRKRLSRGTAR